MSDQEADEALDRLMRSLLTRRARKLLGDPAIGYERGTGEVEIDLGYD